MTLPQFVGEVRATANGVHTFELEADDDGRLTVDGNVIMNIGCPSKNPCNGDKKTASVNMIANTWYSIR